MRIPNRGDSSSWTRFQLRGTRKSEIPVTDPTGGLNINAIEESVKSSIDYEHSHNTWHGKDTGSDVSYIGEEGRKISFNSVAANYHKSAHGRTHRVRDYLHEVGLAKKKPYYLISNSYADYNGQYIITKCDIVEDHGGNFELSWEFQQVVIPKVVEKTFRVWGTAPKPPAPAPTPQKLTANSNTTYLLKNCPVMSQKTHGTKHGVNCVLRLQKFLQAGGYYLKYKLDGWYHKYTTQEVKKAQKKRGLKATGNWDKATIDFYKKLYNIK